MRQMYPLRALHKQSVLDLAADVLRRESGSVPSDPDLTAWVRGHHFTKVRHMNGALRFLPPLYRDLLVLVYGLGNGRPMTQSEAAEALGRTVA